MAPLGAAVKRQGRIVVRHPSRGRPRILHLLNTLGLGGMERQAVLMVRLLRESGRYDVHVAAQDPRGPMAAELSDLGFDPVPSYPLESLYGPRTARQVWRLARLLRARRIDILHTHDFYTNVFGGAAAAFSPRTAHVASRRELDVFGGARRRLDLFACRFAAAVVTNSAFLASVLQQEGVPAHKVARVPNAVSADRVRSEPDEILSFRKSLGLPAQSDVVTFVGNLYNVKKDPWTFLRSAALVAKGRRDGVFLVVGGGTPDGELLALIRSPGLRGRVYLAGSLARIAPALGASDVCVSSSRSEGMPNVVLEYMAAGRPTVATDVGGVREAIEDGHTGYLVPAGDPEAMADRVDRLLRDRNRARAMGRRAAAFVATRHAPARTLASLEALYGALT